MKAIDGIMLAIIGASLVVLFIMNSTGFSKDIGAVGGFVGGISTPLTGSGYRYAR